MLMLVVNLTKLESPRRWSVGRLVGDYLNYFDVGEPSFFVGGIIPWGGDPRLYKTEIASNASIHPSLFSDCRSGKICCLSLLPH